MKNKKLKLLVLSGIGLLGLTACSQVVAKPTDYDSTLITVDDYTGTIYNDLYSVVYDAIRDGNIGSDVLNTVLYRYAVNIFGAYDAKITPAPALGEVTLKTAYEGITYNPLTDSYSGNTEAKTFIKNHKAYWTVNDEGKRINDANQEVADDADPSDSEYARVAAKWETIEDRIAETMYSAISGGSYSDRSVFDEAKYLRSLLASLEDVATPGATGVTTYKGLILPEVEPKDVFNAGVLTRENYQSATHSYVESKIIPDIYRQLLSEQYLLDETYNTLGRSYARKVNVIKFADNKDTPKASDYLVKALVADINAEPVGIGGVPVTKVEDSVNKVGLDEFKNYSNAYILGGDDLDAIITDHTDLKLDTVFTTISAGVYKGTELGDLMTEYNKIKDDLLLTDSSAESKFTNSGAYTKETGLAIETRLLSLKDNTTTGWFIKNGGLSELPDAIRGRLFNIGVANGMAEYDEAPVGAGKIYTKSQLDRFQYDTTTQSWKYAIPTDANGNSIESSYVARINGKSYLKNTQRVDGESIENDVLFYDSSTKTYYVVQIDEAVSSSKLSKSSSNSYRYSKSALAMEEIVNEVTKVVGKSESYSTLATQHFLEKMNLQYHDETVRNYFVSNYPDLFN